ncbi:transposase [Alicyclobacillus fastidiosus]|nr:transposase [Alicyclobacillus fastidiosus]WEH10599.1 transposase [Alicyclobacillus fastidiosus]
MDTAGWLEPDEVKASSPVLKGEGSREAPDLPDNIANWLIERGSDVVLVNPMTTKRYKENRDNSPSKRGPKDAIIISDVISRGYYTTFRPSDEIFRRFQVLVKNREH